MSKVKEVELKTLVGPGAFYIGLLISLLAAFITPSGLVYLVLGILGVIVGLLNITAREVGPYIQASIAFIVAVLGMQFLITQAAGVAPPAPAFPYKGWTEATRLAANLTVLLGASVMVLALKAIYEAAKGR